MGGLVVSRMVNEKLLIGDDIVITVAEFRGYGKSEKVRLHIEAPKHVCVDREEVRKRRESDGPLLPERK